MTIGTPNGWNEYARLVLGQLDSLTKEVQALRDAIAKQNTAMAVVEADRARHHEALSDCQRAIRALDEKREELGLEIAKRSVLYALATAVVTSLIVGGAMALFSGGVP